MLRYEPADRLSACSRGLTTTPRSAPTHPAAVRHGGGLLHVAQHGRQLCSSRGEQRRRSAAGTGRRRPGPATAASPTQGCPAFRECTAHDRLPVGSRPGSQNPAELTVLEGGVGARCCRSAEPLTACTQHRQHAGGQADTGQSSCRRRRLRASVDSEGAGAIGWARPVMDWDTAWGRETGPAAVYIAS